MARRVATAAVLLAIVLTVSGCTSVAVDSYRELPTDALGQPLVEVPSNLDQRGPAAVWLSPDRFAVIHLGGSSSCQPYPTGVSVVGEQEIEVTMFQPWCPIATADMSMSTHELEAPEGIDPTQDAIVHMEGTEILLPALP